MDPERAMALTDELVDGDEFVCGDCGRTVDVSGANDQLSVVALLSAHSNEHHGGDA